MLISIFAGRWRYWATSSSLLYKEKALSIVSQQTDVSNVEYFDCFIILETAEQINSVIREEKIEVICLTQSVTHTISSYSSIYFL